MAAQMLQQVAPGKGLGTRYLPQVFEFFKIGAELMDFFGSVEPQRFTSEAMARVPRLCGTYLIFEERRSGPALVYVGFTENLHRRIRQHFNGGGTFAETARASYRLNARDWKYFLREHLSFYFREYDDAKQAKMIEHAIIAVFAPKFNRD